MSTYGFDIHRWKDFGSAALIVLLPMICIVGQRETGSALVYLSFALMFYREGMPGSVLFTAVAMVIYFVVGIKYENVMLWDTPTSVGKFVVLLLVQIFTSGMIWSYVKDKRMTRIILTYSFGITLGFASLLRVCHSVRYCVGTADNVCRSYRFPHIPGTEHAVHKLPIHRSVCRRKHNVLLFRRLRS